MTRYHVDTRAELERVQLALDQEFGLRDAAGNPTPREQMVHVPGRGLVPAFSIGAINCVDQPGTHWPLIDGGDGTAALQIAEATRIDAKLGRTVSGVALPAAAALLQVNRARDNSLLPAGVRDKLDDAFVDRVFSGLPTNDATATATVTAELAGRAVAALARKVARGSSQALEDAMGIGRSR